jgi:hypothetical protein
MYSGDVCWSWLGCYSLLFPLFVHNFTRKVEMTMYWPELPLSLGNYHMRLHHPLKVGIRKNIYQYTWERGAGLGWVFIQSFVPLLV